MSGPSQSPLGLCLGEIVTLSSPSGFISGVRVTVQHLTVQFTPNNNTFVDKVIDAINVQCLLSQKEKGEEKIERDANIPFVCT